MDQGTLSALAGETVRAVVTSTEEVLAVIDTKTALRFDRAVTLEAVRVEDGFDVAKVIDLIGGRRREFGFVDGSGGEGENGDKE